MNCSGRGVSHGCSKRSSSQPCTLTGKQREYYEKVEQEPIEKAVLATDGISTVGRVGEDIGPEVVV